MVLNNSRHIIKYLFDNVFGTVLNYYFINLKVTTWVNGEKVTKYSDHFYLHFKGQLSKLEEVDLRSNRGQIEDSRTTANESSVMTPTVLMVIIAAGIVVVGAATAAAVISWIRKR